jgi:hypothetical protein
MIGVSHPARLSAATAANLDAASASAGDLRVRIGSQQFCAAPSWLALDSELSLVTVRKCCPSCPTPAHRS